MNKAERVKAVFEGRPVDKVPASFWFHFSGDDRFGDNYPKRHLEYYRATNIDFIKLMNDAFCVYPLQGSFRTPSDWRSVKPYGRNSDYVRKQAEYAARVTDALKGECMTFWTIFEPFSNIFMALDRPDREAFFISHLREDPESVCDALKAATQDAMDIVDLVTTQGGVNGVFMSFIAAEVGRFTKEEYYKWVKADNLAIIDVMNQRSRYNIGHICGWTGKKNNVDWCRDYPVQLMHWAANVEDITWDKGAEYFGSIPRIGGFDSTTKGVLYWGTEEQIREETRRLIRISGKQGVMLGGDCTIPSDIDYSHVAWVMDETYRIGG